MGEIKNFELRRKKNSNSFCHQRGGSEQGEASEINPNERHGSWNERSEVEREIYHKKTNSSKEEKRPKASVTILEGDEFGSSMQAHEESKHN